MLKNLTAIVFALLLAIPLALVPVPAKAATSVSITSPSNGTSASGTSFTVAGTATAKRTITVKVNGTAVGTTTSNSSGNWSLDVTGQTAGAKTIEAVASVQYLYVPSIGASTVSVINTVTNEVVNTVNTDVPLASGQVSPDGTQLVLYQTFGVGAGSQIRVYSLSNPESPSLTNSLTMQATGGAPGMLAPFWSSDSSKFYLTSADFADANPSYISVYNPANWAASPTNIDGLANSCPVAAGMLIPTGSNTMYVSCVGGSSIRKINTATNTFTGTTIDLSGQGGSSIGGGMALVPGTSNAYVQWNSGGYLYPVSLSTDAVSTRISLSATANAFNVNSTGTTGISANGTGASMFVVNLANNTVSQNVSYPGTNIFAAFYNYNDSAIYASDQANDRIMIINPTSYAHSASISVGDNPGILLFRPLESASTSTSFTLTAASADGLADTGVNAYAAAIFSLALITSGAGGIATLRRSKLI